MIRSTLSLVTLAVGIAMFGQAEAVTVTRWHVTQGAASCQAALPVFDGNIRKRPKAIANEGTGSVFITCGFDSIDVLGSGVESVGIHFINRSGVAKTVNCTFTNGVLNSTLPSLVRSVVMPATTGDVGLGVHALADNGGENFYAPAISCEIPAGVEIGAVTSRYPEEVGA